MHDSSLPTINSAAALQRYEILDTAPEAAFDDIAKRAAEVFGAAYAGISFFDAYGESSPFSPNTTQNLNHEWREWFKSNSGLAERSLVRGESFFTPFATSIKFEPIDKNTSRVHVIADTLADKRVRDHRWVIASPYICFYAGALILSRERVPVGVLAVFDVAAREPKTRQLEALVNLADVVSARLEARAEARRERREAGSTWVSGVSGVGVASGVNGTKQTTTPTTAKTATTATMAPAEDEHTVNLTREFIKLEQLLEEEITVRQAAETKLIYEKEFSDAAIASLPGAFFMFDRNGRMVRWNKSFQQSTAYTDDEIILHRAVDFIAPHDRAVIADAIRRVIERGEDITLEADMLSKNGDEAPYVFHGRALDIGGDRYCIGMGRDITERRRAEREIHDAKERLDLALAGSSLALWDWDLAANEIFFSEGWSSTLCVLREGTEGVRLRGEKVISWNHPDDKAKFEAALSNAIRGVSEDFSCEYRVPGADGDWVWLQSSGKVTERDAQGHVRRMTGTSANITARKAAEERVEFLATRDALTGLPNRMLLNDRLELGLANAARKSARLAFMFIDLDRFKTINDSLGHDVGDELLKRVAARLSACVRTSDTVARLGGDEFAIILENLAADGQEVQSVAEKMITSLAAPIQAGEHQLNTSCSLGISIYPTDGQDSQTLMKHADVAMYDAKAKGRNNYQFFSQAMNAKAQERLSIENFLRLALRRNELVLHYQPRVGFATSEITGVEALIRWQHPRLGLLPPDKFISVAEDSGLIVPIGEWVIEEAFRQVATWQKKSGRAMAVAVNLSAGQLFNANRLVTVIEDALKKSGLDAHDVELELTESMLLKNSDETANALKHLGDLGVGIAVDDFGTGYSSLSYLKQLPIDSIKVDSSFVRDIGTDPNDEAIIRAIIAMTHSLKLNVVAEGVETESQYRVLRDLECDEYQGFYFSKPLPPEEFEAAFL
jgi:diguanylate cyclase (GGDEF)-like protein/PAS domain S-box-containing protein